MKAAYIETTGGPEVIRYGDLPRPTPKEGEALVRVGAVAVNPIDTYIRSGAVAMPLPKPFIIGCDLAGTVDASRTSTRAIAAIATCRRPNASGRTVVNAAFGSKPVATWTGCPVSIPASREDNGVATA